VNYQFKWSVLWSGQSGSWLLQGVITTLEISALAWVLAAALGIVSGALRTVPFRPLRAVGTFYVEFFRNVPLLVWMFFWYFGVPPPRTGSSTTGPSSGRACSPSASTTARACPR